MSAVLDFSSFTTAEKTALLDAAKAEMLARAGIGSVASGSSTGQQYAMHKMSEDGLIRMINALTVELGYEQPVIQVAPNFAGNAWSWPNR